MIYNENSNVVAVNLLGFIDKDLLINYVHKLNLFQLHGRQCVMLYPHGF